MGTLSQAAQAALPNHAVVVLQDERLKRNTELRDGAVRLIVALLPKTFPVFRRILSDCSSALWYEVQFTAFSALDRDDLAETDQQRVLALIKDYLMNVKHESGYAAWMAGDLLGEEWNTPEAVDLLEKLLFSARHVAGRKAAIHGIQHALLKAGPSDRERLFSLIRRVASADPSAQVREKARLVLEGVGCHHMSAG